MSRRCVPANQLPLPDYFFPVGVHSTVMIRGRSAPEACPNPFHDRVVEQLKWLEHRSIARVSSVVLADILGVSDRTLRYHLRRLEAAGRVVRPEGPKSGWAAM